MLNRPRSWVNLLMSLCSTRRGDMTAAHRTPPERARMPVVVPNGHLFLRLDTATGSDCTILAWKILFEPTPSNRP